MFPGVPVKGKQTINQRRGTHREIEDRFDLTLECIRRHYARESSPLSETIATYSSFFALFENFDGYVDFFLLNDLVTASGDVDFFHSFDEFTRDHLPDNIDDYVAYRERTIDFVRARNRRLSAWVADNRGA